MTFNEWWENADAALTASHADAWIIWQMAEANYVANPAPIPDPTVAELTEAVRKLSRACYLLKGAAESARSCLIGLPIEGAGDCGNANLIIKETAEAINAADTIMGIEYETDDEEGSE